MPSLLNQLIYRETRGAFESSPAVVFVNYDTFEQADSIVLRDAAKKIGGTARVIKNSITFKVLEDMGVKGAEAVIKGPVLALMGEDPVGLSKAAMDFSKKMKGKKGDALGGIVEGAIVNKDAIKTLSTLPSKDALRGQVLSVIVAPLRGLVTVLSGNVRGLVTVLNAIKEKKEKEVA